jgi:cation:H+ antiporter
MEILGLAFLAVIFGLVGLVWGAENFVTGSAGAARNFGISPLIVGLTIVSLGTSAPEIIVSFDASLNDSGDIGIGNAIGSNLANIGLVLGVTALICPIPFSLDLLKSEGIALTIATIFAGIFLYDANLTTSEGLILISLTIPLMMYIFYRKKYTSLKEVQDVQSKLIPISANKAFVSFFVVC